jgi:hypothetical protein
VLPVVSGISPRLDNLNRFYTLWGCSARKTELGGNHLRAVMLTTLGIVEVTILGTSLDSPAIAAPDTKQGIINLANNRTDMLTAKPNLRTVTNCLVSHV